MLKKSTFLTVFLIALLPTCTKHPKLKKNTPPHELSLAKAQIQLLQAAKDGDMQKVAALLKVPGIDANCKDDTWYKTPLIYAAKKGHTEIVKLLLNAGLTPKQINSQELLFDKTALMYAVNNDHNEIVKLIANSLPPEHFITYDRLGYSASNYAKSADMRALLFSFMTHENFDKNLPVIAADGNDFNLIKQMLDQGFTSELLSCKNSEGFTALQEAAQSGCTQIVALLLNEGASTEDVLSVNPCGSNALTSASQEGHANIVALFLKMGLSSEQISQQNQWRATALMMAAKNGHDTVVQLLLDSGLSYKQIQLTDGYEDGYYKSTALEHAAQSGHQKTVELILEKLESSPEEKICFRAIATAAKNDTAYLQKLVDNPEISLAQIMMPDPHGRTALMTAVNKRSLDTVTLLLETGVTPKQISEQDCNGRTALYFACDFDGNSSIVNILIHAGLTPNQINLPDKEGWTPLIAAASWKHAEIVKSLLNAGLTPEQINTQNLDGATALMWAINYLNKEEYYKKNSEIVRLLISHLTPEQLSVQDWENKTALIHASWNGDTNSVELLLPHLTSEQIHLTCDDGKSALDVGYKTPEIIQAYLDKSSLDLQKEKHGTA